jgi:hypothetical protein
MVPMMRAVRNDRMDYAPFPQGGVLLCLAQGLH